MRRPVGSLTLPYKDFLLDGDEPSTDSDYDMNWKTRKDKNDKHNLRHTEIKRRKRFLFLINAML